MYQILARTFKNFSLGNTLQSIWVSSYCENGKSVYNPRLAETATIHIPGQRNEATYNVSKNFSLMLHLANLKFSDAQNIYPTVSIKRSKFLQITFVN